MTGRTGIQGRDERKELPERGGLKLGFEEQVGFGEEGGLSRLQKEMKGLALPRGGVVTQHRESASCPVRWLKTNTRGRDHDTCKG